MLRMKSKVKCVYVLFSVIIFLSACKKEEKDPFSSFDYSSSKVYLNEDVIFTNKSIDAITYLWDFGDNTSSTEQNPKHAYTAVGNYTIKLTAKSESKSTSSTALITVAKRYTTCKIIGIQL